MYALNPKATICCNANGMTLRAISDQSALQQNSGFDHPDGDRGKITLNSANSPGTVSTSIEPPCCFTMMS
jgi:hypothetical protein